MEKTTPVTRYVELHSCDRRYGCVGTSVWLLWPLPSVLQSRTIKLLLHLASAFSSIGDRKFLLQTHERKHYTVFVDSLRSLIQHIIIQCKSI